MDSGPSAVCWGKGRIDLVYRAADSSVIHCWYTGGTWHTENLGGSTRSDPAISSWGTDHLDVYIRGTDDRLWHTFREACRLGGWYPWQCVGGNVISGPSAVALLAGRLDVIVQRADSSVHHWFYSGSWASDNLDGIAQPDPAICALGTERLDVFVRGRGDRLWHRRGYNMGAF